MPENRFSYEYLANVKDLRVFFLVSEKSLFCPGMKSYGHKSPFFIMRQKSCSEVMPFSDKTVFLSLFNVSAVYTLNGIIVTVFIIE